jgi:hypothetical protein
MTPRGFAAAALSTLVLCPSLVSAGQLKPLAVKPAAQAPARRFEMTLAFAFSGGSTLGTVPATLTPNQTGTSSYVLFTTGTDLSWARGVEARFGYRVSPLFTLEAGVWATVAEVGVAISGDQEGAPVANFTGERLKHMQFEGHLLFTPARLRFSRGRAQPYLSVGGGIVRQLHEGNTLSESGSVVEAGAGLKIGLGTAKAGQGQRYGVRFDLRLSHVKGGFNLGDESRTYPSGMMGFFLVI